MAKPRLIAVIPVLFILNGAFLIIYGFVTGVNFRAIVFAFAFAGVYSPLSVRDFYVIAGVVRIVMAIAAIESKHTRAGMIVAGVLLVFTSIVGIVFSISSRGITASIVYAIVIDFIVMSTLSLIYLRYAFKLPKEL